MLPNETECERQMGEAIEQLFPEPSGPTLESRAASKPCVRVCEVCRETETNCLCRKRR